MKKDWNILYETALKQLNKKEIHPFIKVGFPIFGWNILPLFVPPVSNAKAVNSAFKPNFSSTSSLFLPWIRDFHRRWI